MDEKIFYFFHSLSNRSEFFDQLVIFTAEVFPFIVMLIAFVWLLHYGEFFTSRNPIKSLLFRWKKYLFILTSLVLALVLAIVLKELIGAPRPFDYLSGVNPLFLQDDFAFPSGHAAFFFALSAALLVVNKKTSYIFMIFAFLISISRIIAGVHFPVDILGGFVLGLACVILVRFVYARLNFLNFR